MRIQHNIMAMSAYRNYTNNVSAMKKNLEKLSSGYKINRAGDDAAGLAISEKMRAQITGLETAQKNAKDGISLVQTAEGALTEVHDMLNRMVELATMSANGTYDNTTDRAQLQKELDQLRSEIDRIADSANFNGIQLLNGNMDSETVTIANSANSGNFKIGGSGIGVLPPVDNNPYDDLGENTVLHKDATVNAKGSTFGVNLHNFEFSNQAGDSLDITIGDPTGNGIKLTLKVKDDVTGTRSALTGSQITDAIAKLINSGTDNDKFELEVNGTAWAQGSPITIKGQEFEISNSDGVLTFTQKAAPKDSSEQITAAMDVTVKGVTVATKAKFTVATAAANLTQNDKIIITKDGTDYTLTLDQTTLKATVDGGKNTLGDFDLSVDASGLLTITAQNGGKMDNITVKYEKAEQNISATSNNGTQSVKAKATSGGAASTGSEAITITLDDGTKLGSNGTDFVYTTPGTPGAGDATGSTFTYNGVTYKVTCDTNNKITIEAQTAGTAGNVKFKLTSATDFNTPETITLNNGSNGTAATAVYDLQNWKSGTLKINGTDYTFDTSIEKSLKNILDQTTKIGGKDYKVTYDDGTKKLTLTEVPIANGVFPDDAATTAPVTGDNLVKMTLGDKLTVNTLSNGSNVDNFGDQSNGTFVGDYNVQTVNPKSVKAADNNRLASTSFTLTADMIKEGATLRIGNDTYTFTKKATGAKDIDISDYDGVKVTVDTIAERLSNAAVGNAVYSVGVKGSKITLVEKESWKNSGKATFDLTTEEGIGKSLGFDIPAADTTNTATGKGLILQIGDTADKWNQLKVNIRDTHCDKLGQKTSATTVKDENGNYKIKMEDSTTLADIRIDSQEDAIASVDVIKRAINQISDIRGTLGATQNRLDHTINNLSVMTENIQDAESTIRDVDIAEEMMAYTKNNILIQSAQAMLAQANQVPQGVLQLLQ